MPLYRGVSLRLPKTRMFLSILLLLSWLATNLCNAFALGKVVKALQYDYRLDQIDPSPLSNPAAKNSPGYRASNQMVLYTAASHRPSTETNSAGFEASTQNGVIQSTASGNSLIPEGMEGGILSAHGTAALWLKRFALPGAKASIDFASRNIHIEFTPQVYLYQLDSSLSTAENALSRSLTLKDETRVNAQSLLNNAQACKATLLESDSEPLSALTGNLPKTSGKCLLSNASGFS